MSTTTKAREVATALRAQANATDHLDEEDSLLDTAQLLEDLAALAERDGYQEQAKQIVRGYVEEHLDKSDPAVDFDVYVVWFAKTLQNWKALLSTSISDGMYYEVTHNGDRHETYLDAYKKFENRVVR